MSQLLRRMKKFTAVKVKRRKFLDQKVKPSWRKTKKT